MPMKKSMDDAKDMAMGKKRSMGKMMMNKGSMSKMNMMKGSSKYVNSMPGRHTKMSERNPNANDMNREMPEVMMPATKNRRHESDGRLWDHSS